ncbi:MAG: amino acid ABC transporter substrate-binding protein [Desulfobacterales bacterium]|nr:amino acid ABC transporter substrate-binding protein [Desulfobacterales bacterium]
MKQNIFIYLLFLICIFFTLDIYANDSVTLAIGEWAPYTSKIDPNGKVAEKIITEAFKFVNVDVVYEYYPWKRSLILTKIGKKTGTFPWYKTKERDKEFIYSKLPVIEINNVFFHLKTVNFNWENIEDLKKYKIGDTLGNASVKIFSKKKIKIDIVPKSELNFRKVLIGRIDACIEEYVVGFSMIKKELGSDKKKLFTIHPKPFVKKGGFLLFSKKIPNVNKIKAKFDKGFKRLKDSGGYDKIYAEVIR